MDEANPVKILATKILEMCMISNTSMKIEVPPLWFMSLLKLESMFSSFTELAIFNQFLYSFLSLKRIALFIALKQRQRERNLLSLSKHVSLASDFDGPKNSKSISTFTRNLEIFNAYCEFSDKTIPCSSDVLNYFCERFFDSYFGSRNEIEMLLAEFGLSDAISVARNLKSNAKLSRVAIAFGLHFQKDYAYEESGDLNFFPIEGYENERKMSSVTVSEPSRRVCNMRHSSNLEVEKIDLSGASCLPLEETSKQEYTELLTFTFGNESCDNYSFDGISSNSNVHKGGDFSEEADFSLKEETVPNGSVITASDFCSSGNMSSEYISSYSGVHKDRYSEEADSPLEEENDLHESTTASDFCSSANISSEYISSHSGVHKDHYSDEADSLLKEENDLHESTTASDFCPNTEMPRYCISSRLDLHNEHNFPVEVASPLKEKTDPQDSPSTTDFYSSTEIPNKCILSSFGKEFVISGESFKIINLIESAYNLKESENSTERTSTSFESPEEVAFYFFGQTDFENAKLLQNQFLCAKKYAAVSNLAQEDLSESKNSKIQKDYSEEYCQTSIFNEAKSLLKCEFLEYLQETIEEISPTEEGMYLQLQEKSEFQEHPQAINVKGENKGQYSNVKIDNSEKVSKYEAYEKDLVHKILFSVYDFISEIEGNASFSMEMQNLISDSQVESEDIHSEPDCVKSVRILLYFLYNIKMDLESKKTEVCKLQLDLKDVRELYSCGFKNSKEGRELQESAKKFVVECKKVYAGIEKDLADCEWYYKNLEEILNFYQKKCCFISSLGFQID